MAEATQVGTSLLSTASAVELLLANDAPETDTAEDREEPAAQEESVPEPQAEADEVEVEADEAEDEAEDIEEDEAEAGDDADEDNVTEQTEPTHRVRVGDEEVDVPLSELTSSYMRQSDYTRKTQQVADQRKTVEAELAAVTGERQRYADQLGAIEQSLTQQEPTQDYWDQLLQEDPIEYNRQKAVMLERKDAVEQVRTEHQRVQQEQAVHLQAEAQKRLETEYDRMNELIPEWLDQEVAQKEKSEIVSYAQTQGYSAEELSQVSDARAIKLIRKAWMYDNLMSKKSAAQKQTRQAPKMTRSGQPKSTKQTSKRRQQDALAKVGKRSGRAAMDAAVDYLLIK
jgi:hypothetical protein